ncbi:Alkaline phosphatase [plant metagenome]|uniref:Alkaline phosphatase n=1 Tax=plant metagenome TaxID=1297885 RepID=A0A484TKC6_9ZZZZ
MLLGCNNSRWRRSGRVVAAAVLVMLIAGCASLSSGSQAKNVIVMINDGAGWGTWDAAAYWQYGSREGAPYARFPARYGVTTYPLNLERAPTHDTVSRVGYMPERAWDIRTTGDPMLPFAGYRYLAAAATDSAAAGTALSSGTKTYNGAINHDNFGHPVAFAARLAKGVGKAAGVVTSVPFSEATPAAFGAQNSSRNDYHRISRQMLSEGTLDLVMGTGAPGYNVNGTPCGRLASNESSSGCDKPSEYLAREDWQRLMAGQYLPQGGQRPWRVIRGKEEFVALADGTLTMDGPILGVPEIAMTLQQARQAAVVGVDAGNPSGVAYVRTVPTLALMTRGALRYLAARSGKGFFLMVEGGATDWAAHTSRCGTQWSYGTCVNEPEYGRLIEETADFNDAVSAVVEWIESHGGWKRNLLVVTTDHDNSMPMGPDAQSRPFAPVVNNGKGKMPGFSFRLTGDHSNALVPLWAKGAGTEQLALRVRGWDPGYARYVGWNDGRYIDNTDVAAVVRAVLEGR